MSGKVFMRKTTGCGYPCETLGVMFPTNQKNSSVNASFVLSATTTGLVGATVLVGETRNKLMPCDKIFRIAPLDPSPVDPAFLTEILRVSDVRRQIESNVTETSPTMKNISKPALLSLTFPLPPKSEHKFMAKALANARAKARTLREKAEEARAQGWAVFEATIYEEDKALTFTS
jgi:type I restriction enzyme S subunit